MARVSREPDPPPIAFGTVQPAIVAGRLTYGGPPLISRLPRNMGALTGPGLTLADQLMFSLAGFAASWLATRSFAAPELATFGIAYQWAFGLIALASEAIVSPAIVHISADPEDADIGPPLTQAMSLAGAAVGAAGVAVTWFSTSGGLLLLTLGCALAGAGFVAARGAEYALQRPRGALGLSARRVAVTIMLLAAAWVFDGYSATVAMGIVTAAFLLGTWSRPRATELRRFATSAAPLLREGGWYVLATVARILGYSAGLLVVVERIRGADDAAAITAMFVLAGPTQLLSSSLPLLYMSQLGRVADDADRFRKTLLRQFVSLSLILLGAGVIVYVAFDVWVDITVGDPGLAARLRDAFVPFAVLVAGIVFGSWLAGALKVRRRGPLLAVTAVVSGAVSITAVVIGVPAVWLPAVPYVCVGILMVPAIVGVPVGRTPSPADEEGKAGGAGRSVR